MGDRTLDYIALGVLFFVLITIIYGVIYIHDIPYEMAKKRNHPHQDAIHTAGWVSLFLMHTIWPFLWIWATLYKPEVGWGLAGNVKGATGTQTQENELKTKNIEDRIVELEKQSKQQQVTYGRQLQLLSKQVAALQSQLPEGGEK